MKTINVKNTYQLPISGEPSLDIKVLPKPKSVAVLPASISRIKPKLVVKEGDKVSLGSPLFFDKLQPGVPFLSPAGGTVSAIEYGDRRSVQKVVITLDETESEVSFQSLTESDINSKSREDVVNYLVQGGVWPFIRSFPFRAIAPVTVTPPAIYVSLDNDEPFMPQSSVYLEGQEDAFRLGLSLLKKLSDAVHVGVAAGNATLLDRFGDVITHQLNGAYPANDEGVFLYYNKTTKEENASWYVKGHDVVLLGQLAKTGRYPKDRTVVVAGELADKPQHLRCREGMPFLDLIKEGVKSGPVRYIVGGVLTGRKSDKNGYLNMYDRALHLIPEGKLPEVLSFARLGQDKPSFSKTFASALFPSNTFKMDTSINGGYRSCVACSACPNVCPVGLYPQIILKNLECNDTETALHYGLLDCVDCGLCTYVCPSKIELDSAISSAKESLYKEVIG